MKETTFQFAEKPGLIAQMAEAFASLERLDLRVRDIRLREEDWFRLRAVGIYSTIDLELQPAYLAQGRRGYMWLATIHVDPSVTPRYVPTLGGVRSVTDSMKPAIRGSDNKPETRDSLGSEIESFLLQEPVPYRDFLVKPADRRFEATYWPDEKNHPGKSVVFAGYVITYPVGHPYHGWNAAPGAAWFKSLGSAKTFIDCLHEAGPEPEIDPLPGDRSFSYQERLDRSEDRRAWSKRFWDAYYERLR